MTILGHQHVRVHLRRGEEVVARFVETVRPHVVWTHMALWPPKGYVSPFRMQEILADARRRWGAKVVLHDGDPKPDNPFPGDVSASFDVAMCNHRMPRGEWRTPVMWWPYPT